MKTISATFTRAASGTIPGSPGIAFWMILFALAILDDSDQREKERRTKADTAKAEPRPKPPAPRPF